MRRQFWHGIERLSDFVFGYDCFISYRWEDGRAYAERLRDALHARGLIVFLDSSEFAKGDKWREESGRAVRKSSRLVIVGSPGALDSQPVLHEVRLFTTTGRRIMPIDVGGTFAPGRTTHAIHALLPDDLLRFTEANPACLEAGPSAQVVHDIVHSFDVLRQREWRLRWLVLAVALLSLLTLGAVVAAVSAERARRVADAQRELAESAERRAEERRLVAEGERSSSVLDNATLWPKGLALAVGAATPPYLERRDLPAELQAAVFRAAWIASPFTLVASDATGVSDAVPFGGAGILYVSNADDLIIWEDGETRVLAHIEDEIARIAVADERAVVVTSGGRTDVVSKDGSVASLPLDGVNAAVLSPDGTSLYAAAQDGEVYRCSTVDLRCRPELALPSEALVLAVSGDGRSLAVGGDDGGIRVVSTQTGTPTLSLGGAAARLSRTDALAFSPTGGVLATATQDGFVREWDLRTGAEIARHDTGRAPAVGYSPSGERIAVAADDGTVRAWKAGTNAVDEVVFRGHAGSVRSVAFTRDGTRLVSAGEDGTVRAWEPEPYEGWPVLEGAVRATCGQGHAREAGLLVTTGGGAAHVWRLIAPPERRVRVVDPNGRVDRAILSADGGLLATHGPISGAAIWDIRGTSPRLVTRFTDVSLLAPMAFSPDGALLALGDNKPTVQLVSTDSGPLVAVLATSDAPRSVDFSPDGRRLVVALANGEVEILDVASGSRVTHFRAHNTGGTSACYSRDGALLVTTGHDLTAKVWEGTGKLRDVFDGHGDWVRTAVLSDDGRSLFTAGSDWAVRVWRTGRDTPVGLVDLEEAGISALPVGDGKLAVSVSRDRTVVGDTAAAALLWRGCRIVLRMRRVPGLTIDQLADVTGACRTFLGRARAEPSLLRVADLATATTGL